MRSDAIAVSSNGVFCAGQWNIEYPLQFYEIPEIICDSTEH
jgi:hypothetical protein